MQIEETYLADCYIITPQLFQDERGLFFESFNKKEFQKITGIETDFVQDNQSLSHRGVLRGLHFQTGNSQQAKLVRVVSGSALDVVVDIRKESETFGKSFSLILSAQNQKQLYVPKGFAHGFLALEDDTIFIYKCDDYYNKTSERGIAFNDRVLNIDWGFPHPDLIISEKDMQLPSFNAVFR